MIPDPNRKPPDDNRVAASALLAKASKACAEGDLERMHELIHEAMVKMGRPNVRTK